MESIITDCKYYVIDRIWKDCRGLIISKRGFGGSAPNKLWPMLEAMGSEHASDPCRRHGQKLVSFYTTQGCRKRRVGNGCPKGNTSWQIYLCQLPKKEGGKWLPEGQQKLTNTFMSAIRLQRPAEGRKGKAALVSNFSVPPKVAEVRKGRWPLAAAALSLYLGK